jgi:DDE superfamily endonuclease
MFNAQFQGAVHNSRAWRQTSMFKHPQQLFKARKYLLADLGQPLLESLITPYKKPQNTLLPKQKKIYVQLLAFKASGPC